MAERLGFVTEQLAMHTNETIGGLLNATFGNATELIVAISALYRGLFRLVQLSLLGSVLSNILLVLGCAFWFGGLYHTDQTFGTISSQMNSTLLILATMGILLPTVLSGTNKESRLGELGYSRGTSLVLFFLYFGFIYFQVYPQLRHPCRNAAHFLISAMFAFFHSFLLQLFSHKHLYEDQPKKEPAPVVANTAYGIIANSAAHPEGASEHAGDVEAGPQDGATGAAGQGEGQVTQGGAEEGDDDEEEDVLGLRNALIWLGIITLGIAIVSDAISSTIQNAAESMGMSKVFIAAILLPIVGNAAEHASAVMFAVKGKLDLALGVAIGSSTQISICVLPFLVIIAWIGGYDLSLNFGSFEAATLFLSVVCVTFAIKDGRSDWLLGVTLVAAYIVVALGFWAHNNEDLDATQ
jgi:Ca2+:H+ antiporter